MTEYNIVEFNDISGKPEDTNTPIQGETINNEPIIEEIEPTPNPWDNAPKDVCFYKEIKANGQIIGFTIGAELAYKIGLSLDNYISLDEVQESDVDGRTYLKTQCPMKSDDDLLKDQYRLEITQLKKSLSNTDYKAIKFAEGAISEEEYAEVKEQRQGYRDRINELEALL